MCVVCWWWDGMVIDGTIRGMNNQPPACPFIHPPNPPAYLAFRQADDAVVFVAPFAFP